MTRSMVHNIANDHFKSPSVLPPRNGPKLRTEGFCHLLLDAIEMLTKSLLLLSNSSCFLQAKLSFLLVKSTFFTGKSTFL